MLPKGANLQKIRNGNMTYAVAPHLPGGFDKPETLEKYAKVARRYEGTLKLTSAQRNMISNLKADVLAEFNGAGIVASQAVVSSARPEQLTPTPGALTEGRLVFGDPIIAGSVIADIIRVYPQSIPVLFGFCQTGSPILNRKRPPVLFAVNAKTKDKVDF